MMPCTPPAMRTCMPLRSMRPCSLGRLLLSWSTRPSCFGGPVPRSNRNEVVLGRSNPARLLTWDSLSQTRQWGHGTMFSGHFQPSCTALHACNLAGPAKARVHMRSDEHLEAVYDHVIRTTQKRLLLPLSADHDASCCLPAGFVRHVQPLSLLEVSGALCSEPCFLLCALAWFHLLMSML